MQRTDRSPPGLHTAAWYRAGVGAQPQLVLRQAALLTPKHQRRFAYETGMYNTRAMLKAPGADSLELNLEPMYWYRCLSVRNV